MRTLQARTAIYMKDTGIVREKYCQGWVYEVTVCKQGAVSMRFLCQSLSKAEKIVNATAESPQDRIHNGELSRACRSLTRNNRHKFVFIRRWPLAGCPFTHDEYVALARSPCAAH